MSGSYPTTPLPSSCRIRSSQPTMESVAHNMKRQVRTRGGQRWAVELTYPNKTRSEMAALFAFLQAQRGRYETFTFIPPLLGTRQGTASSAACSGITAAGQRSVAATVTGGTLKAGDLIKFAGHSKAYMLTADAASGAVTLSIEPALYAAVANTEAITVSNVPLTVARAADDMDLDLAAPGLYSFNVALIEVLP